MWRHLPINLPYSPTWDKRVYQKPRTYIHRAINKECFFTSLGCTKKLWFLNAFRVILKRKPFPLATSSFQNRSRNKRCRVCWLVSFYWWYVYILKKKVVYQSLYNIATKKEIKYFKQNTWRIISVCYGMTNCLIIWLQQVVIKELFIIN